MKAKSVINATGVFVDDILKMDNPIAKALVRPSQGVHLVIDKSFLAGNSAMLIPKTADGRVLFVVPWYDHLVVGTTDTPLNSHAEEPIALETEIKFILDTVAQYLERPPARKDVLSVFAGLRPLAAPKEGSASTKELSRDHKLIVSASGLVTITGGKWTTYRKMAAETVDLVQKNNGGDKQTSDTRNIALHGSRPPSVSHLSAYGTDEDLIMTLVGEQPELKNALVNGHGYTLAQVVWAVRSEMAVTVEDVLARRLRLLFLDASAAISAAPVVARVMQRELGWDDTQKEEQLESFYKIAYHYKIN
ncbi:MAG: FAD-dependent oxidoreductase, partial [Sphingobacteriales bacterium]